MPFPDRLKLARKNANLSREELAVLLGVSKSSISNYENGISHPKEDIIYSLFDILKVEPNFLFDDYFVQSNEKSDKTLLENYHKLNEKGQKKAVEYIDDLLVNSLYTNSFQTKGTNFAIVARNGIVSEKTDEDLELLDKELLKLKSVTSDDDL